MALTKLGGHFCLKYIELQVKSKVYTPFDFPPCTSSGSLISTGSSVKEELLLQDKETDGRGA